MKRRLLIANLLCLIAVPLSAQEFDIFERNDFVEPSLHGTRLDNDGSIIQRGETFHVLRVVTGGVANYAWRSTPTNSKVAFVHLANSIYRGAYQANVKFTMLQGQEQRILPRYRLGVEFGRYGMTSTIADEAETPVSSRWLVSGALEENRSCPETANTHCRRPMNVEVGGQFDTSVTIKNVTSRAGGILVWRNAGDDGRKLFRGTVFYQFLDRTFHDRYRLTTAFGTGFERTDAFHWGVTRAGGTLSVDIKRIGTLNAAWTPTYRPATQGQKVFNEVAVFVDRTLFAKLGIRRCYLTGCS
jgi:hypothetical protein